MSSLLDDTVGDFNDYVRSLRVDTPDALMAVTLFDSKLDRLHTAQPIGEIAELTADRYRQGVPRRFTQAVRPKRRGSAR